MEAIDLRYAAMLERAEADPNVLGIILFGSHAVPGWATDTSDYDCFVILDGHDDAVDRWPFERGSGIETVSVSLGGFRSHAAAGTASYWNRPSFRYAQLVLDRSGGEIAQALDAKRTLSAEEVRIVASAALDDYVNSLYRSLK